MNTSTRRVKSFACFSIIFTFAVGGLCHFIYDLTNQNLYVGYFSPINESIWEHLKLLFFPWLLYTLVCYPILKRDTKNYWLGCFLGAFLGALSILILFYTYSGILGDSLLLVDLTIFLISCLLTAFIFYKVTTVPPHQPLLNALSFILLIGAAFLFAYFTYNPPELPLFVDWNLLPH